MRGQRQSAKESVQADVEQWYSELNSMESAGRITDAQNKQYKEMTGWYVKGQEGSELTKSLQLGANTLNSAYAEKIQSNRQEPCRKCTVFFGISTEYAGKRRYFLCVKCTDVWLQ